MANQLSTLIQAVRENSATLGRFNDFLLVEPALTLDSETGDQMAVLIREVKNNTTILKNFANYRSNNNRLLGAGLSAEGTSAKAQAFTRARGFTGIISGVTGTHVVTLGDA